MFLDKPVMILGHYFRIIGGRWGCMTWREGSSVGPAIVLFAKERRQTSLAKFPGGGRGVVSVRGGGREVTQGVGNMDERDVRYGRAIFYVYI